MKKSFFVLALLLFSAYSVFAQKDSIVRPNFSTEVFFVYPHYFSESEDRFDYGFGGMASLKFNYIKISSGLFYTIKRYTELFADGFPVSKIRYSVDYFNVPILVGLPLYQPELKRNTFRVTTGIIVNIRRNYKSIVYYKNGPVTYYAAPHYYSGNSFRLAFQLGRQINKNFKLYIQIFGDYKFVLDEIEIKEGYTTADRFLLGLNAGIEWNYKKIKPIK